MTPYTRISVALKPSINNKWQDAVREMNTTSPELLRVVIIGFLDGSAKEPEAPVVAPIPIKIIAVDPETQAIEMARRGLSTSYIAARLKLPWKQVYDLVKANSHAAKL